MRRQQQAPVKVVGAWGVRPRQVSQLGWGFVAQVLPAIRLEPGAGEAVWPPCSERTVSRPQQKGRSLITQSPAPSPAILSCLCVGRRPHESEHLAHTPLLPSHSLWTPCVEFRSGTASVGPPALHSQHLSVLDICRPQVPVSCLAASPRASSSLCQWLPGVRKPGRAGQCQLEPSAKVWPLEPSEFVLYIFGSAPHLVPPFMRQQDSVL